MSNMTVVTSGAGVAYPSEAYELTLVFVGFMLLQLFKTYESTETNVDL